MPVHNAGIARVFEELADFLALALTTCQCQRDRRGRRRIRAWPVLPVL